ncbi:membrane protein [Flavobacterium sp. ABG]|uniref:DoxX family protein n=1 Tax=Flavobacterium sp. ABG TaxID=1423322 RepID=UPI0006493C59|nr:membrane protein [Flavobacterium sp. ABG]KLT68172.1 membrane protein [Flavobacterium sp. ABG]
MKPLLILISVFLISLVSIILLSGDYNFALAARIAMSAMLLFTAIAHFVFAKGMSMMLPDFIPYKTAVIWLTGFIEIAAAIGLFIPQIRIITAWLLIVFFILILPANIYAATKQIDYQKGTFDGKGTTYLYFRIPLQLLFIVWVYLSAIIN